MATIVRHKETNDRFVLLGSGFGAFASTKPVIGNFVTKSSEGRYAMVCVCDSDGEIGWFRSDEVIVETVDGKQVKDVFRN